MNLILLIILIITLAGCATSHRQNRIYDSTIVVMDSVNLRVKLDTATGTTDSLLYRRKQVFITHTPGWKNRPGLFITIFLAVLAVVVILIKVQ